MVIAIMPAPVALGWIRSGKYSGRSLSAAKSSCAVLPPYSGAISGWIIDAVPSYARASRHDSRKCLNQLTHTFLLTQRARENDQTFFLLNFWPRPESLYVHGVRENLDRTRTEL